MKFNEFYPEYPALITVKQLMDILNIGKNKAYYLINSKTIKSIRVGKRHIIPKINVFEYIINQLSNC